jgi:hypothetical protein
MTIIEKLDKVDTRFQPLMENLYSENKEFARSYLLVLAETLRVVRIIEILDTNHSNYDSNHSYMNSIKLKAFDQLISLSRQSNLDITLNNNSFAMLARFETVITNLIKQGKLTESPDDFDLELWESQNISS